MHNNEGGEPRWSVDRYCVSDTASASSQKIFSHHERREVFFVAATMAPVLTQWTTMTSIEYYCCKVELNQEEFDFNIILNEWAPISLPTLQYFCNMFFRYCCNNMHSKWTFNIIITTLVDIFDVIFGDIAQCKTHLSI